MANLKAKHRKYVESGSWKCDKSPTGAHHWMALSIVKKGYELHICKWCFDCKWLPITFETALRVSYKGNPPYLVGID